MNWFSATPWVIAAAGLLAGGIFGGIERMNYLGEVAGRAADKLANEKVVTAAQQVAKSTSDAKIAELQEALQSSAQHADTYTETIIHVPVTTACAASPAMRDASAGVRDLIAPRGGGASAK